MATGTTVFSRVTVVAPRIRIDLALPTDVSVADLQPMLLDLAKEKSNDGGSKHGGWTITKLGEDSPLDPSKTLASLGVVDGDMLQLRRRSDNPPPPLYDDVVDALAEAEPGSYRPWTPETAARIGHTAGGIALAGSALALGFAGIAGTLYQIAAALVSLFIACLATGVARTVHRSYGNAVTATVIAATGALPMAFVAGLNIVPGEDYRPKILLGATLVLIFGCMSMMLIGAGVITFVAVIIVALLTSIGALIATIWPTAPVAGIAAGAAALGLVGISLLPRLTIQLAKLPLPQVPGSAEELKEDSGFPDYTTLERRTGLAHEYMTGLIIGCGAAGALGATIAASGSVPWGPILAVVVATVLLLRGRSYANGSQAIALLFNGLLASVGVTAVLLLPPDSGAFGKLAWIFPALFLLGIFSIIFGVVFPNKKFSPVQRRTVDILEAILIALVLPLALGVMELYTTIRDLNINLF